MLKDNVMGIILAGGAGKRLEHLTSDVRTQSAVPFGGKFRIIDFVLSSFFNSLIKKLYVLIQHKSISLSEHIQSNWAPRFGSKDEYIRVVGPVPPHWQKGSADGVYQILSRIKIENPDYAAVFGGDQICSFDITDMLEFHKRNGADLTICAMKYPARKAAGRFGIAIPNSDGSLKSFDEKAENPVCVRKDTTMISLGNYIFNKDALIEAVEEDAAVSDSESSHDFGRDVIPRMLRSGKYRIFVFDVSRAKHAYWHSIGTVDDYFDVSMQFIDLRKSTSTYNPDWPVYSVNTDNLPPVRFDEGDDGELPAVRKSIVSDGCVIRAERIEQSALFPNVSIGSGTRIKKCVLFNDVRVGDGCVLEKVISDKRVVVPSGVIIKNGKIERSKDFNPDDEPLFKALVDKTHFTDSGIAVISCYHDYSDRM